VAFSNAYADGQRARAYASLGFSGTYYLAFRDLPALVSEWVRGSTALDFGCGAGRSTRYLRRFGFDTVGIDISPAMITEAQAIDPTGTYLLVGDGDYSAVGGTAFDLILSAFTFDNIPGAEHRTTIVRALRGLLHDDGCIILIVCTPEAYVHEWASFTTLGFPENRRATSGDEVRAVLKDGGDPRPVVDIFWTEDDYRRLFAASGLDVITQHKPVGYRDEPYEWVSETSVAPFAIYVLKRCCDE
jgi:SAM-dependent methyltransferase